MEGKKMTNDTKERIQYGSAIVVLGSGVALAMLSFFLNEYNIETGILMYIAQAFVYAGSIFGVTMYFRTKLGEFESKYNPKENRHDEQSE